MTDISDRAKGIFGKISKKAVEAFNRADELGGDARDYVIEKLRDERVVAVRESVRARIDKLRGRGNAAAGDHEATAATEEEAPAAAAAPASRISLGDPTTTVQIYGRESCSWTGRARLLLENEAVDYRYIDLDDPDNAALQVALVSTTKQNTVPYIYVRGEFIGGYNALSEIQRLGQLEYATMTPAQKAVANPKLATVVIAARPNTDEVAPAETADPATDD
jgi:glutaredoxin 3